MKISLTLICCLLVSIFATAQFKTDQKMIGWKLAADLYNNNLGPSTSSEQHTSNFLISVSFSKFKSPTLFTGFGLTYNYNYNHSGIGTFTAEQINRSHGVGLFVTGTKLQPLAKKVYMGFTGTGGGQYGFGKTTIVSTGVYSNGNSYNVYVNGTLGLFYQLSQRFLVSTNLFNLFNLNYFNGHTNNGSNEIHSNTLNFSSGFNTFSLNNLGIEARYLLK